MSQSVQKPPQIPLFSSLWERLEALPPSEAENSVPLRVLVQLLVAVGIIATDIAAATQIGVWAVPVSFVGATWSWFRRHQRNVPVKFAIALGMLIALASFFSNLFVSLNDTRLVLAQLLIHLQVLHSFDLPRRKDLGYSMVIGLILLGVAGTLSETLAFAPMLIVFLAIALPVLVLDYRSRLGLENSPRPSRPSQRPDLTAGRRYSPLAPQRLGVFTLAIAALGLTIFALLPRFPSYQLRSFPVSAPPGLEDQAFDSNDRGIVNPGYVREEDLVAEGGGTATDGQSPSAGAGELDRTFYYGFSEQINQNLRGRLEPQVVLRLRSQAKGWSRVLAFDEYTGQGWKISSHEAPLRDIRRPRWSYRFRLIDPPTLAQTKEIVQTYTVVSTLPNIIPSLAVPEDLYYPSREIALDANGNLRAPTVLAEGLTYSVISEIPVRDRTQLGRAGENYSDSMRDRYLQVPPEIADRVRQRTEEILATADNPLTNPYEKALFLAQALKQNYEIQPDLPFLDEGEDLVEAFLFRYQGGYPDHFSTALTIMLRSIGIPARLATGFGSGEFNPFTGLYVIRNTDAYALTEVYFPQYGWFAFNPIPGYELIPPSIENSETFGVLRQFWSWVAGWLPSPLRNWFAGVWSFVIGQLVRVVVGAWRFFSQSWLGIFAGSLLLVILSFLGWLGWQQLLAWRDRRRLAKLPPMERLYQQMLRLLSQQGYPKHPAQTPFEYAQNTRQRLAAELTKPIEEISKAYVSWRYGECPPNLEAMKLYLRQLGNKRDRKL